MSKKICKMNKGEQMGVYQNYTLHKMKMFNDVMLGL